MAYSANTANQYDHVPNPYILNSTNNNNNFPNLNSTTQQTNQSHINGFDEYGRTYSNVAATQPNPNYTYRPPRFRNTRKRSFELYSNDIIDEYEDETDGKHYHDKFNEPTRLKRNHIYTNYKHYDQHNHNNNQHCTHAHEDTSVTTKKVQQTQHNNQNKNYQKQLKNSKNNNKNIKNNNNKNRNIHSNSRNSTKSPVAPVNRPSNVDIPQLNINQINGLPNIKLNSKEPQDIDASISYNNQTKLDEHTLDMKKLWYDRATETWYNADDPFYEIKRVLNKWGSGVKTHKKIKPHIILPYINKPIDESPVDWALKWGDFLESQAQSSDNNIWTYLTPNDI